MVLMKQRRTHVKRALFIDGPNLYAASKALGFDIDFKRLLAHFGPVIRAFYYTATLPDDTESTIRPLIDWLDYNGYTMVTKPAKTFTDRMGLTKVKGNMDVEIAVDAMTIASRLDEAVFFTGDGDFKSLLLAMQRQGVHCTVVSTIETEPALCADELRRTADVFIDLVTIKNQITRPKEERRSNYA